MNEQEQAQENEIEAIRSYIEQLSDGGMSDTAALQEFIEDDEGLGEREGHDDEGDEDDDEDYEDDLDLEDGYDYDEEYNSEINEELDFEDTTAETIFRAIAGLTRARRMARTPPAEFRYPLRTEPDPRGDSLLNSGHFGPPRSSSRLKSLTNRLNEWSNSCYPRSRIDLTDRIMIPNSSGTVVAEHNENLYCGNYSKDGSFYYACRQDYRIYIYDTESPNISAKPSSNSVRDISALRTRRVIRAAEGQWTLTDTHLSPGNEMAVYSSLTPTVHLTKVADEGNRVQIPLHLDLSDSGYDSWGHAAVWSVRFSSDAKEVLCGRGRGQISLYDIAAGRKILQIAAHPIRRSDVNAVCFADESSDNVLLSGADDGSKRTAHAINTSELISDQVIKVWDRRSLAHGKAAGIFVGHTEGITFVSPKGDGRYCVSNSKDQTMRLWDLRRMVQDDENHTIESIRVGVPNYDYRNCFYPKPEVFDHPDSCSVMTYTGHTVSRTLIRCHFSPTHTTGQRYLYSGSSDGKVYIWSLDGRIVHTLDTSSANPMINRGAFSDPNMPEKIYAPAERASHHSFHDRIIRDVSWAPFAPILMSNIWGEDCAKIVQHNWKGLGKGGLISLEDWVEKQDIELMG